MRVREPLTTLAPSEAPTLADFPEIMAAVRCLDAALKAALGPEATFNVVVVSMQDGQLALRRLVGADPELSMKLWQLAQCVPLAPKEIAPWRLQ
jgi:hypothetical protein